MEKSCGNCVQCEKKLGHFWCCENSYDACGMPVRCDPPYDEPCKNWSDDPRSIGKPSEALRHFVDHFWDEE